MSRQSLSERVNIAVVVATLLSATAFAGEAGSQSPRPHRVPLLVVLSDSISDPRLRTSESILLPPSTPTGRHVLILRAQDASGTVLARAVFQHLVARSLASGRVRPGTAVRSRTMSPPASLSDGELERAERFVARLRVAPVVTVAEYGNVRAMQLYLPRREVASRLSLGTSP